MAACVCTRLYICMSAYERGDGGVRGRDGKAVDLWCGWRWTWTWTCEWRGGNPGDSSACLCCCTLHRTPMPISLHSTNRTQERGAAMDAGGGVRREHGSSASTCPCFRRCMYVLGNEGSRPIDRTVCGVARLMFVGGWVYACMWMRVVWFRWGVVHVQSSPKHRCEYARTRLLRHREGIHDTSWSLCCPWSS